MTSWTGNPMDRQALSLRLLYQKPSLIQIQTTLMFFPDDGTLFAGWLPIIANAFAMKRVQMLLHFKMSWVNVFSTFVGSDGGIQNLAFHGRPLSRWDHI
ncbi:hypothetical protein DAMNIGENAA_34040 [Desulforhabdus amnigena]|uniref:Uncharacterized protein n=1 Tax=Desulforhabdus amnigena TaxID=40218 RepID=A0A9W6LAP2_9BACT|nr:hypothetical protein DAMNIGENAA_34040 [Desulforhabdus amnigena]